MITYLIFPSSSRLLLPPRFGFRDIKRFKLLCANESLTVLRTIMWKKGFNGRRAWHISFQRTFLSLEAAYLKRLVESYLNVNKQIIEARYVTQSGPAMDSMRRAKSHERNTLCALATDAIVKQFCASPFFVPPFRSAGSLSHLFISSKACANK